MFSPSFYRSGSYIAKLAKYGKLRGINRGFKQSASVLSIEVRKERRNIFLGIFTSFNPSYCKNV